MQVLAPKASGCQLLEQSLFVLTCRLALPLPRLSCTPAGDVIQLLHEESHRTIARATGGGH